MTSCHPQSLSPHLRDLRIRHAGRGRQGQGAQGGGQAGHRLRGGRARLPHPRLHRRGRPAGLRRAAVPQVHAGGRPARAAGGDRGQDGAGTPATRSSASQVLVTNGGKQAVYEAFATLLDPGDEVLVPAPYWTTYPEAIALAGGVTRPGADRRAIRLPGRVEDLEAARTSRTKVLLFVSPSNPTGAVYPPEQVAADRPVGRRARPVGGHRRDLRAPGVRRRACSPRSRCRRRRLADTCVVLNGVAKTYAMTGWRVGWMIGPRDVIERRGEPAEPRDLQRVQRGPGGRARRRLRRPVRRGRHARRRSTGAG